MNLAQSLLEACERHPELEAFPGIAYDELLPRVARIAGGLRRRAGRAGRDSSSTTGSRRRSSTGRASGRGPCSSRCRGGCRRRSSTTASAMPERRSSIRDGDPLPDGPPHEGALDRDDREISLLLYTSGTTGRPKGVPRSHAADRAGGLSQALQHGYRHGDRTLGVMPLYHTMGIHSLLAMHLVGGCYVPQARWDPERGARADRARADHLPVPRPHSVPRPARLRAPRRARRLERPRARLRGRRDDLDRRRALRRGLRARGVREPLRLDRGLHLLDRARSEGEAGVRRPAVGQHTAEARARRRDLRPSLGRRGLRRLLEPARRRREGDPRRLVPHGRHRASRRRRRPLGRRSGRRHDHLGRREHPSARGRGRPREPPRRARGGGDRRTRRPPRAAGSSRSSSATRRPRSSTRTASPRRSRASSARASTVWWRRSRRAHRGRSCAGSCATSQKESA